MRVKTTQSVGVIRFEKSINFADIKNILGNSKVALLLNSKKQVVSRKKRTSKKETAKPQA